MAVQREIERRENEPNDLEQVEDALFGIIDTIAKRDAKSKWIVSLMKKNEERISWHPSTLGYRLEPLEPIKNIAADSDDEGIPRATDLDFNDNVIVSATGHVLAKLMPWNLMDIHEKEREIRKCILCIGIVRYDIFCSIHKKQAVHQSSCFTFQDNLACFVITSHYYKSFTHRARYRESKTGCSVSRTQQTS